jgi:hypothetical protein
MIAIPPKHELSSGFDPRMLIDIAREQAPEFPWIADALGACGPGTWESHAYVRYISSRNRIQPGAEWQFETNVRLDHEQFGTVIIDVLKGNRIGGLEFLDRLG